MRSLIRLTTALSALPMTMASVALFALMVLTFADVIMRSVFNAPIEAATELIRIGIALQRWRDGLVTLGCGVMLWFPAGRVVDLAYRALSYGDVTEYLEIPTFYIGMFIAVMTYLTAVVLILRGLLRLFAPQLLDPAT